MKGRLKGLFNKISPKAMIMLGTMFVVFLLAIAVVYMRKTVVINIDGESSTYVTYNSTVETFLKKQGIEVASNDKVSPALETKLTEDMAINITRAVPVNVVIGGQEHKIMTTDTKVGDVLLANLDYIKEQGGGLDYDDEITPSKDTKVSKNMTIKIVQVQSEEVSENEELPYKTQIQTDYNKDIKSANDVKQQGKAGTQQLKYKVYKYEDGREEKVLQSVTVVSQPVDEILVKGGSYFMASRSGEQIKLKKDSFTVTATAYYEGTNAITATGRQAVRNPDGISTIAVDPSVIPLGSLVYVDGYGKAIAADTGSAIKGNKIDLYLNSKGECRSFGRQPVKIGIIAYPGEW